MRVLLYPWKLSFGAIKENTIWMFSSELYTEKKCENQKKKINRQLVMNPDFFRDFWSFKGSFSKMTWDFHQFICLFVAQKSTTAREIVNNGTCVLLKHSNSLGGPSLFICALVMFLNRVFRQEWFNQFLWFFGSLIKNDSTLRKSYLFSCTFKNAWDIGIYLKSHFYKECQQLRNPTTYFSLDYEQ